MADRRKKRERRKYKKLDFLDKIKNIFQSFWRANTNLTENSKHKLRHKKEEFFCKFLGISTHNFVKNDPNFESKGLFDANFYGTWHEKIFRSQSSDVWGLGLKN